MTATSGMTDIVETPIGPLARGAKHGGYLEFGGGLVGPYRLPLVVAVGKRLGRRLVIVAAQHADEVFGPLAVLRTIEELDTSGLSGEVIACACLNPHGFMNGRHDSPYDQQDMNKVHPGNPEGRATEQASAALYSRVLPGADFLIDVHGGSAELGNIPLARWTAGGELARDVVEHLGVTYVEDPTDPAAMFVGMMSKAALDQGVPSISIEAGNALRPSRDNAIELSSYLVRAMRRLGMLAGDAPRTEPLVYTRMVGTRAKIAGVFESWVAFGQSVSRGEPIGRVHELTGGEGQRVVAPDDGVVGVMRTGVRVHPGESLVWLLARASTPMR